MIVEIYCDICTTKIANAELDSLDFPLRGRMFLSPDVLHEAPPPFDDPTVDWEWMRCRMCRFRPFIFEDRIHCKAEDGTDFWHPLTFSARAELKPDEIITEGMVEEPHINETMISCPRCGKSINGKQKLRIHMSTHKQADRRRKEREMAR